MGASNSYTAAGYGIQGAASFAGSYAQAQALRAQGDYKRAQSEIQARFIDMQAEDAIERGDKAAAKARAGGKVAVGAARAAAAAQGIDVDSGSAALAQVDIEEAAAKDVMEIKNNAWRESWGFKTQAEQVRGAGRMAQLGGNAAASSTLLTGGLQALGYASLGAGALTKSSSKIDIKKDGTSGDQLDSWF